MEARNGVIFDVDGTLLDSVDYHARAWQETLEHFGCRVAFEDVRNQIGKGGDQLMPVFLSEDIVKRRGKDIEEYRSNLFKREFLPRVRAFPAVRDLFERILQDGYKIALASSAKGDELEEYTRRANVAGLLDAETSSDDADRSKPYPDIFLAAMRKAGLEPEHCFIVGDTPYDAEAARGAGARVIGVLCGGFPEQWLRDSGCEAIYRDPDDLLHRYDTSPIGVYAVSAEKARG